MTVPLASQKAGTLNGIDAKAVLNRYLQGETSTQIAASLNVTKQGLSYWLLKHAEDDWKSAQVIKAIDRKEQAEAELDVAKEARDALDLAYARERLKSAQWDLERVCRRVYGQDAPATLPTINLNISYDAPQQIRVIEQETGK